MDFVVFGFGVSALLMLGGFGLRDLGPWLFGSAVDPLALPEFEDAKATIRKQTLSSIGNAVSAAGAGVALVTVAALLGKTTDEIGAIVVGMSLVLAAVGVGAWAYDSIRRYRSAMDIVTAQENSVRSRIQARDARNRALRPDPKSMPKPAPKPVVAEAEPEELEPEEAITTGVPEAEPSPEGGEEIDLDSPLPDWHDTPTTRLPVIEPEITPAFADDEEPEASADEGGGEERVPEITPVIETTRPAPATTRRPSFVPPTTSPTTTQPPAVALDDTLLDEAVRIEPVSRLSSRGNAPSWLFDDLEADLDRQGSDQDDPIDRFREAKPVSRPSALERLLAEDKEKRGNSSDGEKDE